MADQFLLRMKLSESPRADALLSDVAGGVLAQVGYAPAAAADILLGFGAALEQHAVEGAADYDATFRIEGGRLVIAVSHGGGREWRLVHPLPSADAG